MRTRSEEKRREIIDAAAGLFAEQGYERTSMSAISERVGGSKATLYGYFESKEELLRAVLADSVAQITERLLHEFTEDDLRDGLIRIGEHYLMDRLAPLPIMQLRTVATQPEETRFGADYYAQVLRPAWERFSQRLEGLIAQGRLSGADPWTMAMHWKGLTEGELFEKRLLGAMTVPDAEEVRSAAILAADAFLKLYGNSPTARPAKTEV